MKVFLKGFLVDLLAFTKESTPNFASKGKIETTSFSATAAGGDFFDKAAGLCYLLRCLFTLQLRY